jgi:release factor glutamine methyltransferase
MNANLSPQKQAIKEWLQEATLELVGAGITSARLDAELILSHTLRKPRTYVHAHLDESLSLRDQEIANSRLELRLDHVPIAYIIGHKEFYGRPFTVTPATLIPRPESEAIIDTLKDLFPNTMALPGHTKRLVDVGTGSGCLGITAKLELPELDVTLTDISRHTLPIAEKNAAALHAEVRVIKSDLLKEYPLSPDVIIANLPYVDESWERSLETAYEPSLALFAANNGRHLIEKLIDQTNERLGPDGLLLLEADPSQHDALIAHARKSQLHLIRTNGYCLAFEKR